MGTATAIRMLLLRFALACALLVCTRHALSATLTSTPPFNDTLLQLKVSENSCNPYEAQEYFRSRERQRCRRRPFDPLDQVLDLRHFGPEHQRQRILRRLRR